MATQSFSVTIIRPEDLLLLRAEFVDVDLDTSATPAIVNGRDGAMLIVHFQPQHVAEQAFWEAGNIIPPTPLASETPTPPGVVQSRIAGPTRLAFTVPPGEKFALQLGALLDALKRLPLAVTAVAAYERPIRFEEIGRALGIGGTVRRVVAQILSVVRPPPRIAAAITSFLGIDFPPRLAAPNRLQTAIEAPYRLFLSPDSQAKWDHARTPVAHGGRVELWHTRLDSRRTDRDPRVRAIWAAGDDVAPTSQPHANTPFRTALDTSDRNELVHLTSDYYLAPPFTPKPVETRRLMLTTLGAWLDLEQQWPPPAPWTVRHWRHIATMGRDHYVRVVYAGYLLPFRHRASLVKETQRKFVFNAQTGGFIAYDLQRMFILVRERTKTYSDRDMPFRLVEIRTRVTPDLDEPNKSQILGKGQDAFWPRVTGPAGTIDFPFDLVATEWEGRAVEFHAPLIFVSQKLTATDLSKAVVDYNKATNEGRRRCALHGQRVAFAESKDSGDTTHEANAITFAAKDAAGVPPFLPLMQQASVDIPAVRELLGKSVPSTIEFESSYLSGPLAAGNAIGNAANVYAKVVDKPLLAFDTGKSGGLVAPDINITALSRSLGPLGGKLETLVTPTGGLLDPAEMFADVKLLGGIALSTIIPKLQFDNAASAAGELPRFRSVRKGNVIETEYHWTLPGSKLATTSLFLPQPNAEFTITAVARKEIGSTSAPTFSTTGTLTNFAVSLGFAKIDFNSIEFKVVPGKKLDTSVDLKELEFLDFLKFVNELRKVIPMDGFNDPPSLDLSSDGLRLGFSLGIPSIGVGVMTMQNVSLSAGFYLPFVKEPLNFRFAFCERHQPFTLTVSALGGGGFIAMDIGLEGMKSLEASLEFGASVALNLGVASGSVTIMAGIYFQAKVGDGFELTAYIRACGEMDVLGIISVCIEIYIAMTYVTKKEADHGGKLWGQASVSVKIKIAFFSKTVSVSMERELAGSDPNFTDLLTLSDWGNYCEAFDDYVGVGGA